MNDEEPENVELDVLTYEAAGGTERFISFEDFEKDLLVGFCRLRFPDGEPSGARRASSGAPASDGDPVREELQDAALVRELHVYGNEVGVSEDGDGEAPRASNVSSETASDYQHEGYGRRLLREAEDLAADAGFEKLSVISGIGAREYYREKLGYYQDGPYVSKRL